MAINKGSSSAPLCHLCFVGLMLSGSTCGAALLFEAQLWPFQLLKPVPGVQEVQSVLQKILSFGFSGMFYQQIHDPAW